MTVTDLAFNEMNFMERRDVQASQRAHSLVPVRPHCDRVGLPSRHGMSTSSVNDQAHSIRKETGSDRPAKVIVREPKYSNQNQDVKHVAQTGIEQNQSSCEDPLTSWAPSADTQPAKESSGKARHISSPIDSETPLHTLVDLVKTNVFEGTGILAREIEKIRTKQSVINAESRARSVKSTCDDGANEAAVAQGLKIQPSRKKEKDVLHPVEHYDANDHITQHEMRTGEDTERHQQGNMGLASSHNSPVVVSQAEVSIFRETAPDKENSMEPTAPDGSEQLSSRAVNQTEYQNIPGLLPTALSEASPWGQYYIRPPEQKTKFEQIQVTSFGEKSIFVGTDPEALDVHQGRSSEMGYLPYGNWKPFDNSVRNSDMANHSIIHPIQYDDHFRGASLTPFSLTAQSSHLVHGQMSETRDLTTAYETSETMKEFIERIEREVLMPLNVQAPNAVECVLHDGDEWRADLGDHSEMTYVEGIHTAFGPREESVPQSSSAMYQARTDGARSSMLPGLRAGLGHEESWGSIQCFGGDEAKELGSYDQGLEMASFWRPNRFL